MEAAHRSKRSTYVPAIASVAFLATGGSRSQQLLEPYKQEVARSSRAPPINRVIDRLAREQQAEVSPERSLVEPGKSVLAEESYLLDEIGHGHLEVRPRFERVGVGER